MKNRIEHFMWGYQQHFRHSIDSESRRVLDALKPDLDARAFLIGVRVKGGASRYPACVEPEEHHWAKSSDFYDVLGDVEVIQEAYPESQTFQSHPVAQIRYTRDLFLRALRDAVVRRLKASASRPENIRIFASLPVERDGFYVLTILTVAEDVFDDIPRVDSGFIRIHEYSTLPVPCSLIESAIEQIFERSNEAVVQPDAGSGLWVLGSAD